MTERVGYRPSAAARRLRTKASSLIGVVVQSVGDGYIGDVVLGIEVGLANFGYQPLLFASDGRADLEAEALEVFLSEQVTEFIAVSPMASPRLLRSAAEEGLHIAIVNWDAPVPAQVFDDVRVAPQRGRPDLRPKATRSQCAASPSTTRPQGGWRRSTYWTWAIISSSIYEGQMSAQASSASWDIDVHWKPQVAGPKRCCPQPCPP